MINEFRKSIQSVLYERISSPFSGAFILSWFLWNWKLLYYLVFSDANVIERIKYVDSNYINIYNNLMYPFLSTIFLIVAYPFITTGAYWIWLKFKNWQTNIKNIVENAQLIPLDKSMELRLLLKNKEDSFDKIIKSREEEIINLKNEIHGYKNTIESYKSELDNIKDERERLNSYSEAFEEFNHSHWVNDFDRVIDNIQNSQPFLNMVNSKISGYLVSIDVIKKISEEKSIYQFTEKGRYFVKEYTTRLYEDGVGR